MCSYWRRRRRSYRSSPYSYKPPEPYDWRTADTHKGRMHRQFGTLLEEVQKKIFELKDVQLATFLIVLEREEGKGARDHAELSFPDWKSGRKKMSTKTAERVLRLMPRVLNTADKMELVEFAWDVWTAKKRGGIYVAVEPTASLGDIITRVDAAYNEFKNRRFTTEDYASLKWLFDTDAEALKETLGQAERADAEIILDALLDRASEIKEAAIKTGSNATFTANLQFEFPFAVLTLTVRSRPSLSSVGVHPALMNDSTPNNPSNPSNLPARRDEQQSLSVQNADGSISGGALGELISSLPKADQDRLKVKMAERLFDIQAKIAAGQVDTSNVRREVNEVIRSSEELDRGNTRYVIDKQINTEMGKGSIQVRREEIREKSVTIAGKRVDSKCFIATACYTDLEHRNLVLFRAYRDEVLLSNAPGRIFVRCYYAIGPHAANFIKSRASLRAVCTAVLDWTAAKMRAHP